MTRETVDPLRNKYDLVVIIDKLLILFEDYPLYNLLPSFVLAVNNLNFKRLQSGYL